MTTILPLGVTKPAEDISPDAEDRIRDFLARHQGPSAVPTRSETIEGGARGWYAVHAADGYSLRCDWSRIGTREEMQFSEIPPGAAAAAAMS